MFHLGHFFALPGHCSLKTVVQYHFTGRRDACDHILLTNQALYFPNGQCDMVQPSPDAVDKSRLGGLNRLSLFWLITDIMPL